MLKQNSINYYMNSLYILLHKDFNFLTKFIVFIILSLLIAIVKQFTDIKNYKISLNALLTFASLFSMKFPKKSSTRFSAVTSANILIDLKIFLNFNFNPFGTLPLNFKAIPIPSYKRSSKQVVFFIKSL